MNPILEKAHAVLNSDFDSADNLSRDLSIPIQTVYRYLRGIKELSYINFWRMKNVIRFYEEIYTDYSEDSIDNMTTPDQKFMDEELDLVKRALNDIHFFHRDLLATTNVTTLSTIMSLKKDRLEESRYLAISELAGVYRDFLTHPDKYPTYDDRGILQLPDDVVEKLDAILHSSMSTAKIAKLSGLSLSAISRYRLGSRNYKTMRPAKADKLIGIYQEVAE